MVDGSLTRQLYGKSQDKSLGRSSRLLSLMLSVRLPRAIEAQMSPGWRTRLSFDAGKVNRGT